MKSVYDYLQPLNEAPRRMSGDAPFPEESVWFIKEIDSKILSKDFIEVKEAFPLGLMLYEEKKDPKEYFVVGKFNEDKSKFIVFTELTISYLPNSDTKLLKDKKLCSIDTIQTTTNWRGHGISTTLYTYLLKRGYTVLSDDTQYQGAIKLWKSFYRKLHNCKMYVMDVEEDRIVMSYTDKTSDSHIWSDNGDKEHIRLVLTPKN